ncbi:hypothetical protein XELAEV_18001631mg [Xenopus laevis]|nr:hypothetical protein XELAEV_18001631mg [Xenopus laevis]
MRLSITFILLLLLTVTCISALRCYLKQNTQTTETECTGGETQCFSVTLNTLYKGCATDTRCDEMLSSKIGRDKSCCETNLCNK